MELTLSPLPKTWVFDLDGTIVKHNGYLINGYDELLDGVEDFFQKLPKEDCVVILSARKEEYRSRTVEFLNKSEIRYDHIIFEIPYGERILINDDKPSGLKTAYSVNLHRDSILDITVAIDETL